MCFKCMYRRDRQSEIIARGWLFDKFANVCHSMSKSFQYLWFYFSPAVFICAFALNFSCNKTVNQLQSKRRNARHQLKLIKLKWRSRRAKIFDKLLHTTELSSTFEF